MTTTHEPRFVEVFDTTLRDGLQVEGVTATVEDKLRIAEQLDRLGVGFIEGGWPGANPKDIEFFARAGRELELATSTLVAFGSTRRPRGKVDDDDTLRNLVEAGTSAVCIVAKSSAYHVTEALQTTLAEGEAMIADSVRFLRESGRRVLVDMEHFFDGYKADPEFSLRALEAAVVNGATHVVLCDTNGGSLPDEVGAIVAAVHQHVGSDVTIGIHCHDDTGLRGRQLDGGGRRRRRPRAGHAQRPRRAHRQRQPHHDHPQPRAQARLPLPARGPPGAAHEREPPRRRAAEPGDQPAGALRRVGRVRPQGRAPRERHRPGQGRLRARRPGGGRQRHPLRRVRDGGAGDDQHQGRRARPRPRRSRRQRRDRRPQAPRARGLPLRGGRRVARAAHAPRRRVGAGRSSPSRACASSPTSRPARRSTPRPR